MKNKILWAQVSIFNLCVVALLGFILRSKMVFDLPEINFLNLLDAHFHFAFGAWITLALMLLLVHELLPDPVNNGPAYRWIFAGLVFTSFVILLSTVFNNVRLLTTFFSSLYILITWFFSWVFLTHLSTADVNKTVRLLSVSAIGSLVLSSAGPIILIYLHEIRSTQPFFFRDAQYLYLHLQYNGFFTLAIFALVFHKLYPRISTSVQQRFYYFSVLLCVSILPSLFLSFLWQDPNILFRIIAIIGSILIFISVAWFIVFASRLFEMLNLVEPAVRYIVVLSVSAFILKMILLGLTIFTPVGNAVFGDRPIIIGFLHLVFLGFVSSFVLAWYLQIRILNPAIKLTNYALFIFLLMVVLNEIVLTLQGLSSMFLLKSYLYSWPLWVLSIGLVGGAILIYIASIRSKAHLANSIKNRKND
jgi:hypothetical protein